MTLDIAKMDGFPFTDFRDNAESYSHARHFWMNAFIETVGTESARWRPWMDDPLKDGHPIFSMIDETRGRGVLLQQVAEVDDPVWFKCWMSTTANAEGGPLRYLGMEASVSKQSHLLFTIVIARWIHGKHNYDEMLMFIDRLRSLIQHNDAELRLDLISSH